MGHASVNRWRREKDQKPKQLQEPKQLQQQQQQHHQHHQQQHHRHHHHCRHHQSLQRNHTHRRGRSHARSDKKHLLIPRSVLLDQPSEVCWARPLSIWALHVVRVRRVGEEQAVQRQACGPDCGGRSRPLLHPSALRRECNEQRCLRRAGFRGWVIQVVGRRKLVGQDTTQQGRWLPAVPTEPEPRARACRRQLGQLKRIGAEPKIKQREVCEDLALEFG